MGTRQVEGLDVVANHPVGVYGGGQGPHGLADRGQPGRGEDRLRHGRRSRERSCAYRGRRRATRRRPRPGRRGRCSACRFRCTSRWVAPPGRRRSTPRPPSRRACLRLESAVHAGFHAPDPARLEGPPRRVEPQVDALGEHTVHRDVEVFYEYDTVLEVVLMGELDHGRGRRFPPSSRGCAFPAKIISTGRSDHRGYAPGAPVREGRAWVACRRRTCRQSRS